MDEHQCPRHGNTCQLDRGSGLRPLSQRFKSGARRASRHLIGPEYKYSGDRDELVKAVHDALYCSKICAYAQGFQLMGRPKLNMAGNWIWPRSRAFGAADALFGRASYKKSPRPTPAIRSWSICCSIHTSKNKFKRIRSAGVLSWRSRLKQASPLPRSCRLWRITTAIGPHNSRQTSYRPNGIISAPTLTNVSINHEVYRSIWIGPNRTVLRSKLPIPLE